MNKTRTLSKEILERIESTDMPIHNGNQMLEVSLGYRKNGRPRGYYLYLDVYREFDSGGKMTALFSDPHTRILLQETQAFSAKAFTSLQAPQAVLDAAIAQVKAEYMAVRNKNARPVPISSL